MIYVGVFGAHGYLGSALVDFFKGQNIVCIGMPRDSDLIPLSTLHQLTHLIDCGFPLNYTNGNVSGVYLKEIDKRLAISKKFGVNYLYIASYSSNNGGTSKYGRIKLLAENKVLLAKLDIVRVGLVVDQSRLGGRAKKLVEIASSLPLIPLPNHDWFPVSVTNLVEFEEWINRYVCQNDSQFPLKSEAMPLAQLVRYFLPKKSFIKIPKSLTIISVIFIRLLPLSAIDSLKSIAIRSPK